MMDISKLTSIGQLRGEQRELAETIGLEAYKKLIANYAGSPLYVNKPDRVMIEIRNAEIREKFNGSNYRQLAREYGLSEASIRDITAGKRRQMKDEPMEGQLSFEEPEKSENHSNT